MPQVSTQVVQRKKNSIEKPHPWFILI